MNCIKINYLAHNSSCAPARCELSALLKNSFLFTSNEIMPRRPHYFILYLDPARSLLEVESPFSAHARRSPRTKSRS